jgi:hypothetical protein
MESRAPSIPTGTEKISILKAMDGGERKNRPPGSVQVPGASTNSGPEVTFNAGRIPHANPDVVFLLESGVGV